MLLKTIEIAPLIMMLLVSASLQGCGCSNEQLIAEAISDLQLSPSGRVTALVVDQEQILPIALTFVSDTELGERNLEYLIDPSLGNIIPEDIDFIMFVIDESIYESIGVSVDDAIPGFESPTHYRPIRFLDRGIGGYEDADLEIGPAGLRGYTLLAHREEIVTGPSLHELGHAWFALLGGPQPLAESLNEDSPNPRLRHHWNNALVGGVGGSDAEFIRPVCGDSNYFSVNVQRSRSGDNRIPFSSLELYLMGFGSAQDVPPIHIAPVASDGSLDLGDQVIVPACGDEFESIFDTSGRSKLSHERCCSGYPYDPANFAIVKINDIIDHNGLRIPSVEESQKHFRIALLVFSANELSDDDWDFYERSAEFFAAPEERSLRDSFPAEKYPKFNDEIASDEARYGGEYPYLNFYMAVGGRATIEFSEFPRTGNR